MNIGRARRARRTRWALFARVRPYTGRSSTTDRPLDDSALSFLQLAQLAARKFGRSKAFLNLLDLLLSGIRFRELHGDVSEYYYEHSSHLTKS